MAQVRNAYCMCLELLLEKVMDSLVCAAAFLATYL